ncbi:MAG: hypothetical protein LUG13_06125 [Oscillospiraceae bacterium]|nr:hypothetical protein [Oscillospiraceae bacterium]
MHTLRVPRPRAPPLRSVGSGRRGGIDIDIDIDEREKQEALLTEEDRRVASVETALYEQAIGTVEETRTWERRSGEPELVLTKLVRKQSPGSVTAQRLYLCSRAAARWTDVGGGDEGAEQETGGVVELAAVLPPPDGGDG